MAHVHTQREWLQAVTDLAAQGRLVPFVGQAFDLAEAAQAQLALEDGHSQGKVVLLVPQD